MNNLFMFSIKNTEVNFLQNILEEIHQYLIKEIKPTDVSEIAIIKINDFLRTQKFNTNHENVSIYSKAIEEVLETLLLNLSNFSRRSLKINIEKQKQSLELMVKTFRGKLEMFKTTEESLKTNENNCSLESILEFDTIQSEKYHCLFENVKVVSLEALKNVSSGSNSLEFGYKFIKDMKSQINTCLQSIDVNNNFSKAVNLILDYENIINDLEDILNEYKYKDKNEKQINQMISLIVNKILTSTDHNLTNLSMLKDFQNSVDIFLLVNQSNNNNFENFEKRKKKINPNELVSNIEATILRNVEENEMWNFKRNDKEYIDEFQEDNGNVIIKETLTKDDSDERNKNIDLVNNNDNNENLSNSESNKIPQSYVTNRPLTGAQKNALKMKKKKGKGQNKANKKNIDIDINFKNGGRILANVPNKVFYDEYDDNNWQKSIYDQFQLQSNTKMIRNSKAKIDAMRSTNFQQPMKTLKVPSAPPIGLASIADNSRWNENIEIMKQIRNDDNDFMYFKRKSAKSKAPSAHSIGAADMIHNKEFIKNYLQEQQEKVYSSQNQYVPQIYNPQGTVKLESRHGLYDQQSTYDPQNVFIQKGLYASSHFYAPENQDMGQSVHVFKQPWRRGNTLPSRNEVLSCQYANNNGNYYYQRLSPSNSQTRNSICARSKYETQNNAVDMYSKDDQLSKNCRKRCQSKMSNCSNSKKYMHQKCDDNKNNMCLIEFRDDKCELIDDLISYKESLEHMNNNHSSLKNCSNQDKQVKCSKTLKIKKSPRKRFCQSLNETKHINEKFSPNKLKKDQINKNDPLLNIMMTFLEAYKIIQDTKEKTFHDIKSIINYLKLSTIEFNKSQREYNSEIIQKVTDINELFLNINNSLKLTNTKKIYWQIIKIIELIPNEIKNLHKLYIQNLNKRNLYKLNQNSDVSCNKINETFESLNENLKLSSKQIEIITNSDLFQNDNLFAGLSWVLKISEQYHYANAILLLSQKKFEKDILRNIMQENSINKDLNYFKNNCQDFVNIGDGKFGKVYRVTEKSTGNYFALKIYSKNSNSTVTLQFRNIINILKERYNLLKVKNNPFILQMLSSYKLDDLSYVLNFEFCPIKLETYHNLLQKFSSKQYEAELLWEGVNNEVPQTFKKAFQCYNIDFAKNSLVYIFELYCILDFLADCNIIHMDIKTTNIMIGENLHLKLVDFGCITNFDLIQQLNIHENEDLEQSKNFETKSYRDIEIMCGDINDMYPKGYDYYKTSADSGMKNALILKADVLSDLWSMTICAIHLLLNGYSFNLSIPSNIIKEMKLQKLPNTPNYSNCQCEYFMFQICMNKTLFEQFIVNGLQKTGGEEYKSLMNFFISVFNLRNFRAIDYVKCRSNSSINESKMLKMIDIKKVENIEIFLKHNINLDTIYNFEFDSKLKNLLFSDDHVISYSTFDEFSKSLKNLSTDESNLGNDIEIQH